MLDEFKVIIDGVSMNFFTSFNWSWEWISDAYRNENDYMIISNPTKKRKVTLQSDRLNKTQFQTLIRVVGKTDITHTVVLYDEFTETLKSYSMYNSSISGTKRNTPRGIAYEGISFSLIER